LSLSHVRKRANLEESISDQDALVRKSLSGNLGYIGRLRAFLSLHNLKFDLVAFLQALIPFGVMEL
jgi:hypothetical protein